MGDPTPARGATVRIARAPVARAAGESLLAWLDPDPGRAEERLDAIRRKLIRKFVAERCPHPGDLAADTIVRVTRLLAEGRVVGDNPDAFFLGVATNIAHEDRRARRRESDALAQLPTVDVVEPSAGDDEPAWAIENSRARLQRWLDDLEPSQRTLILRYYQGEKEGEAKVARKQLALELGIDIEALHARALRLRRKLESFMKGEAGLHGSNPTGSNQTGSNETGRP